MQLHHYGTVRGGEVMVTEGDGGGNKKGVKKIERAGRVSAGGREEDEKQPGHLHSPLLFLIPPKRKRHCN